MKMIGKKNKKLMLKNNPLDFSSVTIERQGNEIRLRIRNLTTEDQGIYHNLSVNMNTFVF